MSSAEVDLRRQLREQAQQFRSTVCSEIQWPTGGDGLQAEHLSTAAPSAPPKPPVPALRVKVAGPSPALGGGVPGVPSGPLRTTLKLGLKPKPGDSPRDPVAPAVAPARPEAPSADDGPAGGVAAEAPGAAGKKKPPAAKRAEAEEVARLSRAMRGCWGIVQALRRKRDAAAFLRPVDLAEYPHYTLAVKQPMDLGTVGQKILQGQYTTIEDFKRDVLLIWENCRKFNPAGHVLLKYAKDLETCFLKKYEELEADVQLLEEAQAQEAATLGAAAAAQSPPPTPAKTPGAAPPSPAPAAAPVLDPALEEHLRPLQDHVASLRAELEDLKRNPHRTVGDAKVVQAASDAPLQYREVRCLNQMLVDLASDSDTITRVVQMIRKERPKAVSIKDGNLHLETEILPASLVRELQAICEKALARAKKRRLDPAEAAAPTPPGKKPAPASVCSGSSTASAASQKSTKSESSSFFRENLAAPTAAPTAAGPMAAAAVSGAAVPTKSPTTPSPADSRPKGKSPAARSTPKARAGPRAVASHHPLSPAMHRFVGAHPSPGAMLPPTPAPFSPAPMLPSLSPYPGLPPLSTTPSAPPAPPGRGPPLSITNPFALDVLARPPQVYQQALSQLLGNYSPGLPFPSPLPTSASAASPGLARLPTVPGSPYPAPHLAPPAAVPATPPPPAAPAAAAARPALDTSVEPLAMPAWITG